MCRGGRFLKLKDLRISKLNKRVRTQPCSQELENYLSYLSNAYGESDKIPKSIGLELSNCMEQVGKITKPASLAFHIAKFVQRLAAKENKDNFKETVKLLNYFV